MKLELFGNPITEYHVNEKDGKRWTMFNPYPFLVDGVRHEIPVGFWTDYASVPKVVWMFIDPYDLGRGPVIHDYFYFCGYKDQKFCDDVLLAAMEIDNIDSFKRKAAYAAVRMFGLWTWNSYRRKNKRHALIEIAPSKMVLTNWVERVSS